MPEIVAHGDVVDRVDLTGASQTTSASTVTGVIAETLVARVPNSPTDYTAAAAVDLLVRRVVLWLWVRAFAGTTRVIAVTA